MKAFLKTLGHAALGGAVAGVAPVLTDAIPMIPHINPMTAMVLGSMVTSAVSAMMQSTRR